ncbi:MAG TPA: hypothetical protein VD886_12155 [Herpetosiphonaceae bacterium]|nr:hypothetical protein [Herpetosiphonaceae bacterium]
MSHRHSGKVMWLVVFMLGMLVGSVVAGPARSAPSPAAAGGTRMLSFDPYAAHLAGAASFTNGSGGAISMRHTSWSFFTLGFTAPLDYAAGTPLTARVVWDTGATNCTVAFNSSGLEVTPVGGQHSFIGLDVNQGQPVTAPGTASRGMEMLLTTADQPVLAPGDSVTLTVQRSADQETDTCEQSVAIKGVSLIYQTNTVHMPRVQR